MRAYNTETLTVATTTYEFMNEFRKHLTEAIVALIVHNTITTAEYQGRIISSETAFKITVALENMLQEKTGVVTCYYTDKYCSTALSKEEWVIDPTNTNDLLKVIDIVLKNNTYWEDDLPGGGFCYGRTLPKGEHAHTSITYVD